MFLSTIIVHLSTMALIFRQLFEKASSTYTYVLACPTSKDAIIIDVSQSGLVKPNVNKSLISSLLWKQPSAMLSALTNWDSI